MGASAKAPLQRTMQILGHLSHTMPTSVPSPAPWRQAFKSHIEQMDMPTFVLSTVHPISEPSSSSLGLNVAPRARTVVYRGMWGGLPPNPKNPAELNPAVYETDLPTITTDARMEKVPELFHTGTRPTGQSGRGGPVEAVLWASESNTQWRLRGHAYILGPDITSESGKSVRSALKPYMRSSEDTSSWSWSRELTAHFGNLSPTMRGSFRNPPPGKPLSEIPGDGLGLGQTVEDVEDEIARSNFRVLVIVPDDVDRVDLSDPKGARRWNYKLVESEGVGSWKTTELWP